MLDTPMFRFRFSQIDAKRHLIEVGSQKGDAINWFLSGERTLDELVKLRNEIRATHMTIPVVLTRLISPTPEPWELATTKFFVQEQDEIRELLTILEDYLQLLGERMEQWPTSIDEAVEQLISKIPEDGKTTLRDATDDDLVMMHMTLGTTIRNSFGLWAGNKALLKSCGAEDMHPDDASSVIIKRTRERLRQ